MLGLSDYQPYADPSALAEGTGLYMVAAGTALTLILAMRYCTLGFFASILLVVGSLVVAVQAGSVLIALAGGLAFILTMAVVLIKSDRPGRPDWVCEGAGILLLISAFMFFAGIGMALLGVFGMIFLAVFFAGAVAFVKLNSKTLRARELEVVSTLASLMDQRLPLVPGLRAAAGSSRGKTRQIYHRIAHRLEKGLPLWESLRNGWRMCPGWLVSMVRQAETFGRLAGSLQAAQRRLTQELRSAATPRAISLIYPVFVILYVCFVTRGLAYFVFPSFADIFRDEGMADLTEGTLDFLVFVDWVDGPILLAVVVVLLVMLWSRLRARRPDRPRIGSWLGDLLKWHLPVYGWLERKSALAQVAEFLQLGLRSQAPADEVIQGAAELDVNLLYRRRLRKWHRLVVAGEPIPNAARRARLEPVLGWVLATPGGARDLPEVLEALARTQREQHDHVAAICRNFVGVGLVLVAAALVGWVAFSFVYLISSVIGMGCSGVF